MMIRIICLFFSLSALGDADVDFYYREKPILEGRLLDFLKNGPQILVNYPQSLDPKEIRIESSLLIDYDIESTIDDVLRDSEKAISNECYYGFIMIAASVGSDKSGNEKKIKLIEWAESKISDEKFKNSMISFFVKILINKNLLIEGDVVRRDRLRVICDFVRSLRENGFESRGYNQLNDIDGKILEICIMEIVR